MGVINQNALGPIANYPTIVPSTAMALAAAQLMELRAIRFILAQAFQINDSDGAINQSMTTTDLNSIQ